MLALSAAPLDAAAPPLRLSAGEEHWVRAAQAFTRDVEQRVQLAAAGGSDLASARRALHDTSRLYATLVAYTYLGSCSAILHNLGAPSARLLPVDMLLARACRGFEDASSLFSLAVRRDDARALMAASRASLAAFVPVVAARTLLDRVARLLAAPGRRPLPALIAAPRSCARQRAHALLLAVSCRASGA